MKTSKQRTESILQKAQAKEKQRKIVTRSAVAACTLAAVTAVNLFLFTPFKVEDPLQKYEGNEYYAVMSTIDNLTAKAQTKHKNNYEKYVKSFFDNFSFGCAAKSGSTMMPDDAPTQDMMEGSSGSGYVETTDNQVAGVIEGDLLKRTNTHLFYLDPSARSVYIYTVAGAQSAKVGELSFAERDAFANGSVEFYLSADGNTLTVLEDVLLMREDAALKERYTAVKSFDVSNPTTPVALGASYLSGQYLSSRMKDGKLLLFNNYTIWSNYDFEKQYTFLPCYGSKEDMRPVAAEDIHCPKDATAKRYTVLAEIDPVTVDISDCTAFLSYSAECYVSQENVFLTRGFAERKETEKNVGVSKSMTEIACVAYGEGLEYKGSAKVEGSVKNQYSMDEYEGILRVATTTSESPYVIRGYGNEVAPSVQMLEQGGSLYCIDLTDFSIAGKVEKFIIGETVESVRFDKDKAYICTAVVVTMTDPVFVFDLSDLQNITYKDTGVIDGYSSSLIDFNGFLLGIGYGEKRGLKIEVYIETETGVEIVCAYKRESNFSEEYKAYFIDRERGYVGLGIGSYAEGQGYLLLQFDGYELREVLYEDMTALGLNVRLENMRATLIDGYFYIFGDDPDCFVVKQLQ